MFVHRAMLSVVPPAVGSVNTAVIALYGHISPSCHASCDAIQPEMPQGSSDYPTCVRVPPP